MQVPELRAEQASLPPPLSPRLAMADVGNLTLDPRIRDWVLLPLTGIIILVQLLRTIVAQLLSKTANKEAEEIQQR